MATLILVVLSAIFFITHFFDHLGWGVVLLQSMAEAGMIGALADWFAVEALFRRPLGLPIPHTALLPANQKRAAENVGRFFQTYFLEKELIRVRILELQPARYAFSWLVKRQNARQISGYITGILEFLVVGQDQIRLTSKLSNQLRKIVMRAAPSEVLAAEIVKLLSTSAKAELTDDLLRLVRSALEDSREDVVTMVQDRSRWWIAARVDREVANRITDAVLSVIDELMAPSSRLRVNFDSTIERIIKKLAENGSLSEVVSHGKEHLIASEAFDDLVASILNQTRDQISAQVQRNPQAFADDLAQPIRMFAVKMSKDKEARQKIEDGFADAVAALISELKPLLGNYVSDMIGSWEPEMLIDRFEVEVGRDLQFIRINGSVLGAAIGGAICLISFALN
ncbi:DUF445 domain-containing protein [Tropicibacter sp. R16_0]|uniref:DUF445 domain-containing protein n=1 Tax=Tropicibacter sp. R16_0 TaxID=2821102 RepID=UPI001ADCDFF1|nr:DUF445 domain-containing protein [Tropicibacter sp. R16_0]